MGYVRPTFVAAPSTSAILWVFAMSGYPDPNDSPYSPCFFVWRTWSSQSPCVLNSPPVPLDFVWRSFDIYFGGTKMFNYSFKNMWGTLNKKKWWYLVVKKIIFKKLAELLGGFYSKPWRCEWGKFTIQTPSTHRSEFGICCWYTFLSTAHSVYTPLKTK